MNKLSRHYTNWMPQANFQYRPSLQKSISFFYSGYTSQPSIDQIQPVRVNTDPLNITLGNANLKPWYSQNININYNSAKILSGTNSYISAGMSNQYDLVVNNTVTDIKSGKTTIQYVNLTEKTPWTYRVYASTSRKIKPIGLSVGLSGSTYGSFSYSYINSELNTTKSRSYSSSVNISKSVTKKYNFYASAGPRYTYNEFSLQNAADNNAAGFGASGNAGFYLPAKIFIGSDVSYTYTAATRSFGAQYVTIWSASLNKSFFKDENLTLGITANDLLNNNLTTYRNAYANTITQTNNTGIGRYIMFSVTWNFTKFGTEPAKK